jgi:DNA-binding IclR family transcriptional regulator
MIQSVDRALQIIELFIDHESLTLTEIYRLLGLKKSTAFGLLETLEARGYLRRDKMTQGYKLGPTMLKIGSLFAERLNLHDAAYPIMQKLCDDVGLTVQLSTLVGMDVVYLEKVEPDELIQFTIRLGSSMPAHCTGTGKALLSCLSEEELDEKLRGYKLKQFTPYTITDSKILKEDLRKARALGYAKDFRESNENVVGYAVPIYNYAGHPIAGISVGGFLNSFPDEREEYLVKKLCESAEKISNILGYKNRESINIS